MQPAEPRVNPVKEQQKKADEENGEENDGEETPVETDDKKPVLISLYGSGIEWIALTNCIHVLASVTIAVLYVIGMLALCI